MKDKNNKWFELKDIELDMTKYNDFEKLRKQLRTADKFRKDSYYLDYCEVKAKLSFFGKLSTPNGEIETTYDYHIKTKLDDFLKKAQIDIYEQTLNSLDHAVSIKFSSGSIISKIVFGDIEKAYTELKKVVIDKLAEYNEKVEKFNKEIEELKEKEKENE